MSAELGYGDECAPQVVRADLDAGCVSYGAELAARPAQVAALARAGEHEFGVAERAAGDK